MNHRMTFCAVFAATLLVLTARLAAAPGGVPADQVVVGRPWTSIFPDPDRYDWSRNDRPGYHIRQMTPNQRRFYDYITAKGAAGQGLTMTEQAMRRWFITARLWPEGPRPNAAARAYIRWLRAQTSDRMNLANEMLLSQLMAQGFAVVDVPPGETLQRLIDYLKSERAQPRNWFERSFGRVEPWLTTMVAAQGYNMSAVRASDVPAGQTSFRTPPGDGPELFYSLGNIVLERVPNGEWRGIFEPGATLTVSCTIQVGGLGSDVHISVGAGRDRVREITDYVPNDRAKTGKPSRKSYTLSVPAAEDALVGTVLIENHPRYTMGNNRGDPVLRATLTANESRVAAIRARQDALWQQQVEATLRSLADRERSALPARQVEEIRSALADGDAAWQAYVDREQERLGYTKSTDAAEFRALAEAIAGPGAMWAAYVAAHGGPPPAGAPTPPTPPAPPTLPTPPATAGTNLALNRPASQSSTYRGTGFPLSAGLGVDGIFASDKDPQSLFHTNLEDNPWWQVDLGAEKSIREVRLHNRVLAAAPEIRARANTIQVLLSSDGVTWRTVYRRGGQPFDVLRVTMEGARARYVRVQLAERNYLHLHEVEVFGP